MYLIFLDLVNNYCTYTTTEAIIVGKVSVTANEGSRPPKNILSPTRTTGTMYVCVISVKNKLVNAKKHKYTS